MLINIIVGSTLVLIAIVAIIYSIRKIKSAQDDQQKRIDKMHQQAVMLYQSRLADAKRKLKNSNRY